MKNTAMEIRRAAQKDIAAIRQLFTETILSVNTADYSRGQAQCWASKGEGDEVWKERIATQYFIVAEEDNVITGFAALKSGGYLNSLFVHKDRQRMGVASALLAEVERHAAGQEMESITADVSITAKPFFLKKGYRVLQRQVVDIGMEMTNYRMTKLLI